MHAHRHVRQSVEKAEFLYDGRATDEDDGELWRRRRRAPVGG